MKKIFTLFIIACLSGCFKNDKDLRPYFHIYAIDRTFAQELARCRKYETPVRYLSVMNNNLWDFFFPKYKNKIAIIGTDEENRCIIRSYESRFLSPFWRKRYEYYLPKDILPYFSDILQTAFDAPWYHETKAVEMLHSFCNQHRDFCKDADTPPYGPKEFDEYGNTYFGYYMHNLTSYFIANEIPVDNSNI